MPRTDNYKVLPTSCVTAILFFRLTDQSWVASFAELEWNWIQFVRRTDWRPDVWNDASRQTDLAPPLNTHLSCTPMPLPSFWRIDIEHSISELAYDWSAKEGFGLPRSAATAAMDGARTNLPVRVQWADQPIDASIWDSVEWFSMTSMRHTHLLVLCLVWRPFMTCRYL